MIDMNILFFLTPKNKIDFVYDDFTMRQVIEKMSFHHYSAIPILNKTGEYIGTITEGDLLWSIKDKEHFDIKDAENIIISDIKRNRDIKPIYIYNEMDDLISKAINQNFVPVIDDYNKFIGIITRKDIIQYCYKKVKSLD